MTCLAVMRKSKASALIATALAVVFLIAPAAVRADIVDLLTFQSGVDAAQAVDPTLAAPSNDVGHDFAVGGFRGTGDNQVGFSAHSDHLTCVTTHDCSFLIACEIAREGRPSIPKITSPSTSSGLAGVGRASSDKRSPSANDETAQSKA